MQLPCIGVGKSRFVLTAKGVKTQNVAPEDQSTSLQAVISLSQNNNSFELELHDLPFRVNAETTLTMAPSRVDAIVFVYSLTGTYMLFIVFVGGSYVDASFEQMSRRSKS
jgi:hypothetical protein